MLKCKNVIVNILVCPQSLSFCPVDLQYVQCLYSLGRGEAGKRGGSWSSKWKLNHDWVNRYRIFVLWFTTDMFCLLSESDIVLLFSFMTCHLNFNFRNTTVDSGAGGTA